MLPPQKLHSSYDAPAGLSLDAARCLVLASSSERWLETMVSGEPNFNTLKTLDGKEATIIKSFVFRFESWLGYGKSPLLHARVHRFRVDHSGVGDFAHIAP